MEEVSGANLLTAFAYLLLLGATAPKLAHFTGFEWAMLPIWLVMVVYVASILKNLSTKDRKERFDRVMMLALFAYFAVCLVWPFPLEWYDSLLLLSLFAADTVVGKALQGVYYFVSAATYMQDNNIVQTSARLIITGVLAGAVVHAHKDDVERESI